MGIYDREWYKEETLKKQGVEIDSEQKKRAKETLRKAFFEDEIKKTKTPFFNLFVRFSGLVFLVFGILEMVLKR